MELELKEAVQRGASGPSVKRVQEWLTLRGHGVQTDGAFGPATQAAVRHFQASQQLEPDGIVSPRLFALLASPMRAALAPIEPAGRDLGAMIVAYAQQHLACAPREVGGANRGPWVRLYMDGNEGPTWRWCAGFACMCVEQASAALHLTMPLRPTFSCDLLAASAVQRGLFVDGDRENTPSLVRPGWLFLVRRARRDWKHVGIIVATEGESFETIEGNTNDDGSADGHCVARRTRSFAHRDFIQLATPRPRPVA